MRYRKAILLACLAAILGNSQITTSYSSNQEHVLIHAAIDQFRLQIRVAQACAVRASHNELKEMCERQIAERRPKIDQLLSWSKQWQSTEIVEHRDILKAPAVKKVLVAKGPRFDVEYLKLMRVLNDEGQPMWAECKDRAAHEELRLFCSGMEPVRAAEVQQGDRLLSECCGAEKPSTARSKDSREPR